MSASYNFTSNIDPSLIGSHGDSTYNPRSHRQYDSGSERPRSHIGPNYSPDPEEVISNASAKMLENNSHFVRVQMTSEKRAMEITRLEEALAGKTKENDELREENKDLKVEVKALRGAIELFAKEYHESTSGIHINGVLASLRTGTVPAKPALHKRTDCPTVVQWTRKDFRRVSAKKGNANRGKTDGNATSAQQKGKRGRPRKDSNDDNHATHHYLENEDGTPVDADLIAEMSRKARMLWATLDEDGMAPPMSRSRDISHGYDFAVSDSARTHSDLPIDLSRSTARLSLHREVAAASPVCAEQIDLARRRELCRRTPVVTASSDRLSPVRNRVNLRPVRSADAHPLSSLASHLCGTGRLPETERPETTADTPVPLIVNIESPDYKLKTYESPSSRAEPRESIAAARSQSLLPERIRKSSSAVECGLARALLAVSTSVGIKPHLRDPTTTAATEHDTGTLSDSEWAAYTSDRSARRAKRKLATRGLTLVSEDAYPPVDAQTTAAPPIPASAAQHAEGPRVIPAPVQTLVAPSIAPPPRVSTPQNGYIAQRVEKRQRDDTSDEEETHRHKYPRLAPHIGPPRARPQLARRSVPLPHKIVYKPRRATSAPVTSTPRFLVPYSPPPRRPPSPPDDPVRAPPPTVPDPRPSAPGHTVVEGDNSPMRGVKTLDISGFDSVLAQEDATSTPHTENSRPPTPSLTPDATDSTPQTPPRVYLFPRHALERPHDPDELATKTIARQRRGHSRVPYPTTSLQHERHGRRDQSTTAPADTSPTPITFRYTRKRRRANAAAPSTSPPQDRIAARARDRHVHAAPRRVNQHAPVVPSPNNQHPIRAVTTETAHTTTTETTPVTNRANAAVELFLRQYDAARTTTTPTPVPPDRAYDAVAQHLDYCLVTDPDTTRITQPFALRPEPRAVLHKWKKK
ncbi:hypothetical protein EDB89DRAFT_2184649 [Lactarius sanguifluus]|nr:hypothetical protein EDB89DRAFT_2184649 [Lactarius sanguifluus]